MAPIDSFGKIRVGTYEMRHLLKIFWASTLASLVLILQLATVSPALHLLLHEDGSGLPGCCDHGSSSDHGENGSRIPDGTHVCGVVLIAGGLTLSPSLEIEPVNPERIGTTDIPDAGMVPVVESRRSVARAPPVL